MRPGRFHAAASAVMLGLLVAGCSQAGGSASGNVSSGTTLAGTSWTVTTVGGTTTIANAQPTIVFGTDGSISGTSGCNTYSGTFGTDGDKITIGHLASTMMACEPDRNAQEQAFTTALQGATHWKIDSGTLHLTGENVGEIVASSGLPSAGASAPAAAGLAGTSWALTSVAGSVIDPAVKPTLLFDATGNASGNGGCNTFNGSYTVDGATIAFGPMISTKMACVGPGDLVESAYSRCPAGGDGLVDRERREPYAHR